MDLLKGARSTAAKGKEEPGRTVRLGGTSAMDLAAGAERRADRQYSEHMNARCLLWLSPRLASVSPGGQVFPVCRLLLTIGNFGEAIPNLSPPRSCVYRAQQFPLHCLSSVLFFSAYLVATSLRSWVVRTIWPPSLPLLK